MMAASREPFATVFRHSEWHQDVFMKECGSHLAGIQLPYIWHAKNSYIPIEV
jgi:hypothetical protein